MRNDLATRSYWDEHWQHEPRDGDGGVSVTGGLRNHVDLRFDEFFRQTIGPSGASSVLEIGCGGSKWLPYFARHLGLRASGIDYSPAGCRSAEALAAAEGVDVRVVCADLFDPPSDMVEAHDVVVSFGVLEHFTDTAGAVAAFSRFLRPGGLMLTLVPNMVGAVGMAQRLLNRPVYDIHVPLSAGAVGAAHAAAGLDVRSSRYFLFSHFGVCSLEGLPAGGVVPRLKRGAWWLLVAASVATWAAERARLPLPPNRLTSPYVWCIATKPAR